MSEDTGLQMKYFVLKPKGNTRYAKASRAAMFRYSSFIRSENPKLADDIFSWAEHESITANLGEEIYISQEWHGRPDDI